MRFKFRLRRLEQGLLLLVILLSALVIDFFNPDFGYFRSGLSIAREQDMDFSEALALFDRTCFNETASRTLPIIMGDHFVRAGLTAAGADNHLGKSQPNNPANATHDSGYYRHPTRPLIAYTYQPAYQSELNKKIDHSASLSAGRGPSGPEFIDTEFAFHCVLMFENFDRPDQFIAPVFQHFADTRLTRPMAQHPEAVNADLFQEKTPWDYAQKGTSMASGESTDVDGVDGMHKENDVIFYQLRSFVVGEGPGNVSAGTMPDMQYVIALARQQSTGKYLLQLMMRPL